MADDEDSEEPAVTLGEGAEIEGVPLAQVSARFMWGIERSAIDAREGETVIRTPDGPQELGDILSELEKTYFATKQEFEDAVRDVIGSGPVPTPGEEDPEDEDVDAEKEEPEGEDADEGEDGAATEEDEAEAEESESEAEDDESDEESDEESEEESDEDSKAE